MALNLDYTKLASNGNLTVFFYPANAFANFASPTVAELNAGINLSKAIAWDDFGFGTSASNTNEAPSIADTGNTKDRGAAQYGGAMSFFQPGPGTQSTDTYKVVKNALQVPRTKGYIVMRLDGMKPFTQAFAAGDLIHVYSVLSDGQTNVMTGDSAFRYTINFLQQGNISIYTVARATTATVVINPSTLSMAVGSKKRLQGTVLAREYTNGLLWTSSDATKATVSDSGTVTALATGTVTITGTFLATGASATCTITIS